MDEWLIRKIVEQFAGLVAEPMAQMLVLVRSLVLQMPDVTSQRPVLHLVARSLSVVQAGYVVVAAFAGLIVIVQGNLQTAYTARELLERLAVGYTAAHLTTWVVNLFVAGGNAVAGALSPGGARLTEQFDTAQALTDQVSKSAESVLLVLVIQVLIVVLLGVLVVGWIFRFIGLSMATGVGPLALACHGTPWTNGIAEAWWGYLLRTSLTVVAQAGALQLGLELMLDPEADAESVGGLDRSDVLTNLLLVLCLLMMVVRMPAIIGQFVPGRSGGRSGPAGTVLRYVLLNRVVGGGRSLAGSAANRAQSLRGLAGRTSSTASPTTRRNQGGLQPGSMGVTPATAAVLGWSLPRPFTRPDGGIEVSRRRRSKGRGQASGRRSSQQRGKSGRERQAQSRGRSRSAGQSRAATEQALQRAQRIAERRGSASSADPARSGGSRSSSGRRPSSGASRNEGQPKPSSKNRAAGQPGRSSSRAQPQRPSAPSRKDLRNQQRSQPPPRKPRSERRPRTDEPPSGD